MTTSEGSVWDRGPSGDDGDRPDTVPAIDDPDRREPVDAPVDEPVDEPADAGTVWSRGPAIDAALPPAAPARNRPMPVLPPAPTPVSTARSLPEVRRPLAVFVGATVVVLLGVLAWTLGVVGGDEVDPAIASGTTESLLPAVSLPTAPTTAPTPTTAPVAATPAPSTTTSTTSSTSTSTTSSTSTSTTSTTSTTTSTTTVPAAPVGPQVAIVGTVGPCRFGNDCLIADFTIRDFAEPQREFVCEFENGSRYRFRFDGVGAERACAVAAADGTITIEVGGVRSETITR